MSQRSKHLFILGLLLTGLLALQAPEPQEAIKAWSDWFRAGIARLPR